MNRVGNLISRISDMDNLMLAFHKASKGKWDKEAVWNYADKLEDNLYNLSLQIQSGDVDVGNYTYFKIYDPKLRTICAASFPERVLHHALMNVCHSVFERHFIYTTYATRPGKGVYAALDRAFYAINNYNYVGKFDVRHYFDTIDHQILKNKLSHLFKDKVLLKIFFKIIDSYKVIEGKGLPIGNLTSQYFANYYLSSFDHWCKEILKSREYIRYMDDFLLFSNEKDMLEQSVVKVNDYMKTNLLLDLKIVVLSNNKLGISFLGYNLSKHRILLNLRSKKRLRNKMNIYAHLLTAEWTEQQYMEHITPLLAFSRYGYTKRLRHDIIMATNI